MSGECPKCETNVTNVRLEGVTLQNKSMDKFKGIKYLCPFCKTILGVSFDPFALKADTVSEIVHQLKGR